METSYVWIRNSSYSGSNCWRVQPFWPTRITAQETLHLHRPLGTPLRLLSCLHKLYPACRLLSDMTDGIGGQLTANLETVGSCENSRAHLFHSATCFCGPFYPRVRVIWVVVVSRSTTDPTIAASDFIPLFTILSQREGYRCFMGSPASARMLRNLNGLPCLHGIIPTMTGVMRFCGSATPANTATNDFTG